MNRADGADNGAERADGAEEGTHGADGADGTVLSNSRVALLVSQFWIAASLHAFSCR